MSTSTCKADLFQLQTGLYIGGFVDQSSEQSLEGWSGDPILRGWQICVVGQGAVWGTSSALHPQHHFNVSES